MVNSMFNAERNILLIVEGADDEVNLFKKIIQCFPEISLSPENVLVYNTNLWVLNEDLEKEFGTNWYESEDIDFRIFCESRFPQIKGVKITDIFLVFDYERQDPKFDPAQLENLCRFFNDSVENGQLYINYPMIESYRHLNKKPLPDEDYKERKCKVSDIANYKFTVGSETKFHDYRKLDRALIQEIITHNLRKASFIMSEEYDLIDDKLFSFAHNMNYIEIAKKQNHLSKDNNGFIYVLCTCVLFVTDYNVELLTKPIENICPE